MNYLTGISETPVYEFPYSGHQISSIPNLNNNVDAILASVAPTSSVGNLFSCSSPTITLNCVPQINTNIASSIIPDNSIFTGSNTVVFQVPESMPVDVLLQQLGISTNTLQYSDNVSNYYRSTSQPIEFFLPSSSPRRARRMVCHEVSDSERDNYIRRPSHHHPRRRSQSWSDQQEPIALHNLLNRVWSKAEQASRNLPSSSSGPNINAQWQAMKNAPPLMSSPNQNAISNVWRNAEHASELRENQFPNMFNRMPQSPLPQNQAAVQDFLAARNLPYGVNMSQSHDPAVNNFLAARNLPYGVNVSQSHDPAVNNFLAARNVPYGVNAAQSYDSAVNNFLAARNIPYGSNLPNPAISNAWNNMNRAMNQLPPPSPPMNNPYWNPNQPPPPRSPFSLPVRPPVHAPAPMSFASILAQAHQKNIPYAGVA